MQALLNIYILAAVAAIVALVAIIKLVVDAHNTDADAAKRAGQAV
jgi:hypothetical protein